MKNRKKSESVLKSIATEGPKRESTLSYKEIQKKLPRMVRTLREEQGVRAVDLCRKSGGLDPKTLAAVEAGRIKNPSIQTLHAITQGLNMSIAELFRRCERAEETSVYTGDQKGAYRMDFPKWGCHIISFTPLNPFFFCGKLILAGKRRVTHHELKNSGPIYLSTIIGRSEITVDRSLNDLKEGENVYIEPGYSFSIKNPRQRELTLLLVTSPGIL